MTTLEQSTGLTRAELQSRLRQRMKPLEVPGLGPVMIRPLSAAEVKELARDGKQALASDDEDEEIGLGVKVVLAGVVDRERQPLFDSADQVLELFTMEDIEFVMQSVFEYSGCGEEKRDAVKNSDAPTAGD